MVLHSAPITAGWVATANKSRALIHPEFGSVQNSRFILCLMSVGDWVGKQNYAARADCVGALKPSGWIKHGNTLGYWRRLGLDCCIKDALKLHNVL